MAVNSSTGFANAILGANSFETLFRYGCVQVYSGAQPASANLAPTGTLLGRITKDGGTWSAGSSTNGLVFVRDGRTVRKNPADSWVLTGLASGIAGWFRWLPNQADPGTNSTTAIRIDGAIGLRDAVGDFQLFLPNLSMSLSSTHLIADWWYSIPPFGE